MVIFSNLTSKDQVLTKANEIKKHSKINGLWINKDLFETLRIRAMEVRKCYNLMRQKKHKCQSVGATIHFNDRIFEHRDLHKLPPGCNLEDTQMIVLEDNISLCF